MPNKRAASKALRQTKKNTAKNARMKTHIKKLSQHLIAAVKAGKKDEAIKLAHTLQQAAAKAGKLHIFHKNKAGRTASAAQKTINAIK